MRLIFLPDAPVAAEISRQQNHAILFIMPRGFYKYDWAVIQRYYDEGHNYVECRRRFGFAKDTWIKAIARGDVTVRPRQWSILRVLRTSRSRYTVKRRLLAAGILKNVCDECGLSEWRGLPITIQLDHRNGIRDNHRLENLRMLCPNCHSQTETYAARNRRRFRRAFSALLIPTIIHKRVVRAARSQSSRLAGDDMRNNLLIERD